MISVLPTALYLEVLMTHSYKKHIQSSVLCYFYFLFCLLDFPMNFFSTEIPTTKCASYLLTPVLPFVHGCCPFLKLYVLSCSNFNGEASLASAYGLGMDNIRDRMKLLLYSWSDFILLPPEKNFSGRYCLAVRLFFLMFAGALSLERLDGSQPNFHTR